MCRVRGVICKRLIVRINYKNGKVICMQSRGMAQADRVRGHRRKDKIPNVQKDT